MALAVGRNGVIVWRWCGGGAVGCALGGHWGGRQVDGAQGESWAFWRRNATSRGGLGLGRRVRGRKAWLAKALLWANAPGGAIQQTLSVVLVLCPRLGHCLIQRSESGHCPRFGPNGLFGGYLLDDGSPTIPSHRNRRQGELGEFGELGRVARPCGISRGVVHTSYCD